MSTLNPNIFQYERLPDAAYDAAVDGFQKCGFFPEPDYSISSRIKEQLVTIKINALAFAHPIHRNAEYAGITLFNAANGQSDEELVNILTKSTAPFHLIHRGEHFSLLASSAQNKEPEPIRIESHIANEQLDGVLNKYAVDLKPQRIIDVKQGRDTFTHPVFRNIAPLQLPLWAAGVTGPLLVEYFGHAVDILRSYINDDLHKHTSEGADEVTDLAIQLLGATILADTGVFGKDIRIAGAEVSLSELISLASNIFFRYFKSYLFEKHTEAAEKAYQLLRQIRYAGFMPDMLRDLYIEAYSEEERKNSGSYDTPLYLTRQIWKNIPVEYLPPEQRIVADLTCGWGSFLIAGHERLSNLGDMKDKSLLDYLRGNDKYPFTAKLAGLGLLLSTSEDSWHIDREDAMKWEWLRTSKPNIIVGNPPFGGSRGIRDDLRASSTAEQKRQQKADEFLWHAIKHLARGGYLAMVMPRSFTAAEASPELRSELLKMCDVLELWQLPSGIFKGVNPQSMAIFAQKKRDEDVSHYPVRVRTMQRSTLKNFQDQGTFTASQLVVDQSNWSKTIYKSEGSDNTHIMEYKLILSERVWQKIVTQSVRLEERADIFRGAIVGSRRRYFEYDDPKLVPWLSNAKKTHKRPFRIEYEQSPQTKLYPNDFEEPRLNKKHIFEGTKVLAIHSPDPSWGKRAKVAIERNGYYVSGSYWVVTPLPEAEKMSITHEVLAAIINWDVSNAWLIEHMTSLGIPEYAIDTVPFPKHLSNDDCKALTEAVLQIEKTLSDDEDTKIAAERIDAILKAAYRLDDDTFKRLHVVANWNNKTQISFDHESVPNKANWFISGIVDSVDAEQNTITLWMEGFDGLQKVQIAPSMPGWMLRPNAAFRTKIPDEYVEEGSIGQFIANWGLFSPQPYTYLSGEGLFARLTTIFEQETKSVR